MSKPLLEVVIEELTVVRCSWEVVTRWEEMGI